ncbi:hypothetical protein TNCT_580671 [Trichonephila clavata]|uniref:Uncharacterized protein n=1 Tax=Trichonephila clavata TaxID=2740835 RepID=A0A8X6FXQ9_TRICU|nr:hypothetical protein TNCT_580671 [Trichonephila clavata]
MRTFGSLYHFIITSICFAVANIFHQSPMKKRWILWDHCDFCTQRSWVTLRISCRQLKSFQILHHKAEGSDSQMLTCHHLSNLQVYFLTGFIIMDLFSNIGSNLIVKMT